jgi:hypothetical protein
MKSRIDFNVKGIEYIQFTPIKKLDFKYFKFIPEQRMFFGLIRTQEALYDGWSVYGDPSRTDYGWCDWKTTDSLKKEYFQQIEGTDQPWYAYAYVHIQKLNSSFNQKFKTNDEAIQFIEELKIFSGEKFKVIHNE